MLKSLKLNYYNLVENYWINDVINDQCHIALEANLYIPDESPLHLSSLPEVYEVRTTSDLDVNCYSYMSLDRKSRNNILPIFFYFYPLCIVVVEV